MNRKVVCIGSALIDELYFCMENVIPGTSNPAISRKFPGGVISNIARHLALLNISVELISVIGKDMDGKWLLHELEKNGVNMDNSILIDNDNTGKYISVLNPDGSLFTAACSDICAHHMKVKNLEEKKDILKSAELLITDTNIDSESIQWLIDFCRDEKIKIIIEPVSVAKARKLSNINIQDVFMITPNMDELNSLCTQKHVTSDEAINELINRGVKNIWLRKGSDGSVIFNKQGVTHLEAKKINVKDSTGAGDAALAGWVAAYLGNQNPIDCMKAGHSLAFEVLQISGAVKSDINMKALYESIKKYY